MDTVDLSTEPMVRARCDLRSFTLAFGDLRGFDIRSIPRCSAKRRTTASAT